MMPGYSFCRCYAIASATIDAARCYLLCAVLRTRLPTDTLFAAMQARRRNQMRSASAQPRARSEERAVAFMIARAVYYAMSNRLRAQRARADR